MQSIFRLARACAPVFSSYSREHGEHCDTRFLTSEYHCDLEQLCGLKCSALQKAHILRRNANICKVFRINCTTIYYQCICRFSCFMYLTIVNVLQSTFVPYQEIVQCYYRLISRDVINFRFAISEILTLRVIAITLLFKSVK